MIKELDNEKLKSYLRNRDEIFQSILTTEDFDDEKLKQFNRIYTILTPLEFDILYLHTLYGLTTTAELYGCSKRLINYKIKDIKEKLHKK